jgi:hypothetical protein
MACVQNLLSVLFCSVQYIRPVRVRFGLWLELELELVS